MTQRSNPVRDDNTIGVCFNTPVAITNLYRFVKISTVDSVALATAVTDKIVGINQSTTELANTEITVKTSGYSLIQTGASFAVGAYLTTDSTGRAVATTTATDLVCGMATQTANAVNEFVEMKLFDHPVLYSALV